MGLSVGDSEVSGVYVGDAEASEIYLGDELVWSAEQPAVPTANWAVYSTTDNSLTFLYSASQPTGTIRNAADTADIAVTNVYPAANGWGDITYTGSKTYGQSRWNFTTNAPWFGIVNQIRSVEFRHKLPNIPAGTDGQMAYWFAGSNSIVSIVGLDVMGETLSSIGIDMIPYCQRLTTISLPPNITTIREEAFWGCTQLSDIKLPENLITLKATALTGIASAKLTLPVALSEIEESALGFCTSLTRVDFLGTPTSIHSGAFLGCSNLTDIYVPWSEGEIAGAPWGATRATIHYGWTG